MKNKKSLLGLGLLALVLVLGVGYAVVSQVTLTFNGSAAAKTEALNVDIESVIVDSPDGVTVDADMETHSKTVTFSITDMTLDQAVKLTYKVRNHEKDVDAKLVNATLTGNNSYFTAEYLISDGDNITADGGEATVEVTVRMKKTPVEDNGEANFTFTVDAVAVEK